MKEQLLSHLDEPRELEKLYRGDKTGFRRAFNALYPQYQQNPLFNYWNERLNYARQEVSWGSGMDVLFVILAALVAGFTAKLPALFHIDEGYFYPRNIGLIIFPALTAWFAWKNQLTLPKLLLVAGCFLLAGVFINLLPRSTGSDTLILSCIHVVVFLWALSGIAFMRNQGNTIDKRLDYLKYNGDLLVMTCLIVVAGGIMTGITIGLFNLIGFQIQQFYFEYVVIFGLPAAPILASYLIQTNPQLVGKVSPVIARIFSPLVVVMLLIYLSAIIYSGKDPYNDREFLIIFNALLIGVLAIIFFSVAETSRPVKTNFENWTLLSLATLTLLVNGIALSAIIFRIIEWGLTPNRAAVLGTNTVTLFNLLLITIQLYRVVSKNTETVSVRRVIGWYLPFYIIWAAVVTFLFPFLFGFK
jgi:hypothetical protein